MNNEPSEMCNRNKRFLTEKDLAERWQVSVKLPQKMRYEGGGPRFTRIGRAVRYHISDVREYEARNGRSSTSDSGPAN